MRPTLVVARRISQRALQEKTGVNTGTISQIERGLRVPKPELAEVLAEYYGMKPDEFRGYAKLEWERRKNAAKQAS